METIPLEQTLLGYMVMSRLELWLLTKLIRKMLYHRCTQRLIDIMWNEAKQVFSEDNVYDRHLYFTEKIELSAQTELSKHNRRL